MEHQNLDILNLKIKRYIDDNNLSLRQFAAKIDMPCSTLSRIMNGKQKVNLSHLNKINKCVEVTMEEIYSDRKVENNKENIEIKKGIEDLMEISNLGSDYMLSSEMTKQYEQCEEFAKTELGQNMIKSQFCDKIKSINGVGPLIDTLRNFYDEYILENPYSERAILLGAALIYFILPIDAIPDYLFGIGFLDDLIIINLVKSLLKRI